jgi:hypothetical protein
MKISGHIKVINEIQQISANFQKREFVIETNEQYPQTILLELHGDKVDLIDVYSVGEEIDVSINIRGREWLNPQGESKFFNTIVAWRIERISNSTPPEPQKPFTAASEPNSFVDENEKDTDDLPF